MAADLEREPATEAVDAAEAAENTPLLRTNPSDEGSAEEQPLRRESQPWHGHAELAGLKWWKRPSVYWLLPPFFLWTIAFGGTIVPKINLIVALICRQYMVEHAVSPVPTLFDSGTAECRKNSDIEVLVTKFTLYMSVISGVMSALVAPHLGALSDRYGRKPLLVYTALGTLISEGIVILCVMFNETLPYGLILLGSFFEGACGGFIVGMAITHSYATDCTPPTERAVVFAYFHSCLFGGIALGPFVAGYLIKWTGEILDLFYFALGCQSLFILALLLIIPESLTIKRQLEAREKHRLERYRASQEPWSTRTVLSKLNIFSYLSVLYPTGPGSSPQVRINLLLLASVDTIIFGVAMSAASLLTVYTIFQFGWDNFQTSMFVSAANATRVTALLVVLPLANRFLRNNVRGYEAILRNTGCDRFELNTIRFAVLLETVGYAGYAAARTPAPFVLSGIIAAFGGIGSPTLQSALTKHVPVHRTGEVLGAVGLLHALARVLCPTVTNLIYANTSKTFPQTIFVVLACAFGTASACSWFIKAHVYLEDDGLPPQDPPNGLDQDPVDEEAVNA